MLLATGAAPRTGTDGRWCAYSACFVDVRDLALAHVLSITKEEASGNRIIINAGAFKWQDFGESSMFRNCRGRSEKDMHAHDEWVSQ